MYKLSAVLTGHTSDVRAVASLGSDSIVSASRDKTGRVWRRAGPNAFSEESVLVGHTAYVNTAAMVVGPEGAMVATGGADKTIRVWRADEPSEPARVLQGHTDNVCALAVSKDGTTVVSGSWDKTARVWRGGECERVLKGHTQAVWSVLVLDDGTVVTGSADKTIRRWRDGRVEQTYEGHTDCVRALVRVPGVGFASASNDGTVRVWAEDGQCVSELHGHTSFVYALAVLSDGAIVSAGEDRSVRVWRGGENVQTILLPATSVWSVSVLSNDDIVCGSSDSAVRVFSADAAREASPEVAAAFAEATAAFVVNKKTLGDINTASLPGTERLQRPGTKDQQVIMVRSGSAIEAHQWDAASSQWSKVGDVVDAVGQTQRQLFNGKEYDYVFDVDIGDDRAPLKLPYNTTENPYAAAQNFIHRNGLSIELIDQVATFITKNAAVQTGPAASYADPFTGGSRYIPGLAGSASSGAAADPFTGGSRYVPAQTYSPPSEPIVLGQGNVDAILGKLSEFDASASPPMSASQKAAVTAVGQGIKASVAGTAHQTITSSMCDELLQLALAWPSAKRFPALDLFRLAVAAAPSPAAHSGGNEGLVAAIRNATELDSILASSATAPLARSDEINLMMGVRALANACAHRDGESLVWEVRRSLVDALDGLWARSTNKNLADALAVLYFNLAVAAVHNSDEDAGLDILAAASRFLGATSSPDAQLRLVNVFGVLGYRFRLCKDSAKILGDESIVILGINGKSDALRKAAREVGAMLTQ